jgi:acetyl esterase/lipase
MRAFACAFTCVPFAVMIVLNSAAPASAQQQPQQRDPFQRLDRDGDGKLSREELPEGLRNAFNRIDANGDGSISREEDRAFRERQNQGSRVPDSVTATRDIPYAGTDHPRQQLDLYLPKQRRTDQPLPVVVFIHGGAWLGGDKRGEGGQVARFAATGEYTGVSIGYRLSRDAIWPAQIHDCKSAIRWIRAHAKEHNLDPDRIGVMGTSAGGHLVAMLGTSGGVPDLEGDLGEQDDQSSRVTCVVDFFGPSDMLTIGDYPSRLDHKSPTSPESLLLGGPLLEMKDAARSASPTTHATEDDPPFLIVHGDNDQVVPFNQSERMHAALVAARVPSIFIRIEGGGHGGFNGSELDRRVKLFFDKHLLGREATIPGETLKPGQSAGE